MHMIGFLCMVCFAWQQPVAYYIDAHLNTEHHMLEVEETLVYVNRTTEEVKALCFCVCADSCQHADEVIATEKAELTDGSRIENSSGEIGNIVVHHVRWGSDTLDFFVDGSVMILVLPFALGFGDSCQVIIDYSLRIPELDGGLGYHGDHYEMIQWYLKLCGCGRTGQQHEEVQTFDGLYSEFGSFDVQIDIPGDYVVAATGERIDPFDIAYIESLIINQSPLHIPERRKVRFCASQVHDFAWVCDPDYHVRQTFVDSIALLVFALQHHENAWQHVVGYAADAVERYNKWFGRYPRNALSIVDSYNTGGVEYPQLVLVSTGEDRFTRMFELVIVHEIARQWFFSISSTDEDKDTWLDEGCASYAELRYFEDKYGEDYSLVNLPFFPSLSRRYFHRVLYYLTHTNKLEKPLFTSSYEFINIPVAYQSGIYSKTALLLIHLEGVLGREIFDRILKRYVQEHRFGHRSTDDFVRICDEESDKKLGPLIKQAFHTKEVCDWRIAWVRGTTVKIENNGVVCLPVDVYIESERGTDIRRVDGQCQTYLMSMPDTSGTIQRVIIDPQGYSLESNYWNNYYPPRIELTPIYSLPSFDAYQIRWFPYLWYGSYDGIIAGLYLGGAQFVDFDVVKGRHQWIAGCTYGFRSGSINPVFSYQTPIIYTQQWRTRIAFQGSARRGEDSFSASIINNIGIAFSTTPQMELTTTYRYDNLKSYAPVDTVDWELGVLGCIEQHLTYSHSPWQVNFDVEWSNKLLGSSWNYAKVTGQASCDVNAMIPFRIRMFAGKIFGTAPSQQRLYLSGSLRITMIADLLFGQSGYLSPQEHVHIPGDGNMRGYQTLHIKSDELVAVNLQFPSSSPLRVFTDIGYYGDYAFDVGVRFVLGPVSLNIPLYMVSDEPWSLRWSIGF
jgi:hypothetical protein